MSFAFWASSEPSLPVELQSVVGYGGVAGVETLITGANNSLREAGSLLVLMEKMHRVNKKMLKISQTGNMSLGLLTLALLGRSISVF